MANPRDVELDIVGNDKTGAAARAAARNLDRLRRKVDDVNTSNNSVGKTAQKGASQMAEQFVKTAAILRSAGPIAAVGALGAAIVALPTIAAAAGVGIVLGLGGGLAAIGIKAALTNKKVRDAFSQTKKHVVDRLKEMAQPFEPVLIKIAKRASSTFDSFAPALEGAFKRIAPALDRFSVSFFTALKKLEPAIKPVSEGFVRLLDQIGPRLPGIFKKISDAIIDITDALMKNPEAVSRLITGFENIITATGKVIAWLIRMNQAVAFSVSAFKNGVLKIAVAIQTIGTKFSDTIADVLEAGARLPGPMGKAFRKVSQQARAEADASNVALQSLKTDQSRAEVEMLRAKIRLLKGKKVVTEADRAVIAQSEAKIRSLQGSIDALKGKTIRVGTIFYQKGKAPGSYGNGLGVNAPGFASTMTWEPLGGSGMSRTGGPAPVRLTNETTVDARVYIDGDSLRSVARSQVRNQSTNDAWRSRVGTRR